MSPEFYEMLRRERYTNALRSAFVDLFAAYPGGRPGHFDVDVENVNSDGSMFDLVVTFKTGKGYCCAESHCHFPHQDPKTWMKVRNLLEQYIAEDIPPMTIRFIADIEDGVMLTGDYLHGPRYCERCIYEEIHREIQ